MRWAGGDPAAPSPTCCRGNAPPPEQPSQNQQQQQVAIQMTADGSMRQETKCICTVWCSHPLPPPPNAPRRRRRDCGDGHGDGGDDDGGDDGTTTFFPLLLLSTDLKSRVGSFLRPLDCLRLMSICGLRGVAGDLWSFGAAIHSLGLPTLSSSLSSPSCTTSYGLSSSPPSSSPPPPPSSCCGGKGCGVTAIKMMSLTHPRGRSSSSGSSSSSSSSSAARAVSLGRLCTRFVGLRRLRLRLSHWTAAWADAFAVSMASLAHLRSLSLDDNILDRSGMRLLAGAALKGSLSRLQELSLRQASISGPVAAHALSVTLGVLPCLAKLDLDENGAMGDDGVLAVVRVAELVGSMRSLTWLSMEGVGMTDVGMAALARAMRGGTLPELDTLRLARMGDQATDGGLLSLVEAGCFLGSNSKLRCLRIFTHNKGIKGRGAEALFDAMAMKTTTTGSKGVAGGWAAFPALVDVDVTGLHVVSEEGVSCMSALGRLLRCGRPLPCVEEIRVGDRGWSQVAERGMMALLQALVDDESDNGDSNASPRYDGGGGGDRISSSSRQGLGGCSVGAVLAGLKGVISHAPVPGDAIMLMARAMATGVAPNVAKLALNLSGIDDVAAQRLSEALLAGGSGGSSSCLLSLEYLEILLRPSPPLSRPSALALEAGIRSLPNLTTLSLICADDVMEALADGPPPPPSPPPPPAGVGGGGMMMASSLVGGCCSPVLLPLPSLTLSRHLKYLTCYGMKDEGMAALARAVTMGKLTSVQCLCLGKSDRLVGPGVCALVEAVTPLTLPSLHRIGLTSCPGLTDQVIHSLMHAIIQGRFSKLQTFIIADCPLLSVSVLLALASALLTYGPPTLSRVGFPAAPRLVLSPDFPPLLKALQARGVMMAVR